jgi:hypothetical protein
LGGSEEMTLTEVRKMKTCCRNSVSQVDRGQENREEGHAAEEEKNGVHGKDAAKGAVIENRVQVVFI